MKRWITKDDISDVYFKAYQKGVSFILKKLNLKSSIRTIGSFDKTANLSSNWWDIPYVKRRWNLLITQNPDVSYQEYLMSKIMPKGKNLNVLSLGSGDCSKEIKLASFSSIEEITCVDFSGFRINDGKKRAEKLKVSHKLKFICSDIKDFDFQKSKYDLIYFDAALHHFKDVNKLLSSKIDDTLKSKGFIVINEYVGPNRLQFPKHQIERINESLKTIPLKFRKRFKTDFIKRRITGSGVLRMIISDPSECVDSENIISSLRQNFKEIVFRPYGGNLLMLVLKDIAHHFIQLDDEKKEILDALFTLEDKYLENHKSDFVFGIYQKR